MEAPKAFDEVVLKLKENGTPFTLRFSIQSSSLLVNITEDDSVPSINYSSKFNLSDLKEQNRYFRMFLVITDTLDYWAAVMLMVMLKVAVTPSFSRIIFVLMVCPLGLQFSGWLPE